MTADYPNIYDSIAKIMREVGPIGKDNGNSAGGYNTRGVDSVINALQPLFVAHGVFPLATIIEQSHSAYPIEDAPELPFKLLFHSKLHIRYKLVAADGSFVETDAIGEATDGYGMPSNAAMSLAIKYALCQLLMVTTAMVDGDTVRNAHENERWEPTDDGRHIIPPPMAQRAGPSVPTRAERAADVPNVVGVDVSAGKGGVVVEPEIEIPVTQQELDAVKNEWKLLQVQRASVPTLGRWSLFVSEQLGREIEKILDAAQWTRDELCKVQQAVAEGK